MHRFYSRYFVNRDLIENLTIRMGFSFLFSPLYGCYLDFYLLENEDPNIH